MIITGFTMLFIPQNSVNAKFTNANPSVSPSNFYITNKTFNFTDYNFNPNYAQGQMPTYVIINGYLAIFHFGQDTTTAPTTNGFAFVDLAFMLFCGINNIVNPDIIIIDAIAKAQYFILFFNLSSYL